MYAGLNEVKSVELVNEWCGNPKGMILKMWSSAAQPLIDRGVAKEIMSASKQEEIDHMPLKKAFRRAPMDRMIHDSVTK